MVGPGRSPRLVHGPRPLPIPLDGGNIVPDPTLDVAASLLADLNLSPVATSRSGSPGRAFLLGERQVNEVPGFPPDRAVMFVPRSVMKRREPIFDNRPKYWETTGFRGGRCRD